MNKLNRDARRYLRRIRGWIPCTGSLKRKMISQICGDLTDFLEEKPDADYGTIVARFGTPQQIAAAYVDETETGELLKMLRIRRRIVTITLATATILVAMWAATVTAAYLDNASSEIVYIIESIEVIE